MKKALHYLLIFILMFSGAAVVSQELPPGPIQDGDKNWASAIGYDLNGQTVSKGVSYYNGLGKGTQSQGWDILRDTIWASQTLYDYHGRPAFQSFSAPIGTSFGYADGFIRDLLFNQPYTTANFEWSENSPSMVSPDTPNTLGHYYSNNNTSEPYQDITSYPFIRTVYSRLNPGAVKKVLGGNKVNGQWLQ